MSNLPNQTAPVYATDEDIAVHAAGDFAILCPPWQSMAQGIDGAFDNGAPWVLTSMSVDFELNGVRANQVVWLTAPKSQYPGSGSLLAIDNVSGNTVTLRRLYKDLYVGQPPAPTIGMNGVAFAINTLDAQSAEASFDIKRRFGIDENIAARTSSWIYDLQDLRLATVLAVLHDRYAAETRMEKGDFALKLKRIRQQLDDVIARVQVRWGPTGNAEEPSTIFNCRLSR